MWPGETSSFDTSADHYVQFAVAGRTAFFIADDGSHGSELWATDGSAAGTRLVRDIAPDFGAAFNRLNTALTDVGPLLLFSAFEPDGGREPWRSDGSERGTRRVQDLAPGVLSSDPRDFTAAGPFVFFAADDAASGNELWAAARQALAGACAGDCDEDARVDIAELLAGVNLALGRGGEIICAAGDPDLDGRITVAELLSAIGTALHGCPQP